MQAFQLVTDGYNHIMHLIETFAVVPESKLILYMQFLPSMWQIWICQYELPALHAADVLMAAACCNNPKAA